MNFFNKPYPFNDDLRHNAKIIFFISIGILAFLLLFQPIDITTFDRWQIFYLASGLAASTFLSLTLNLLIIPSLLPKIFLQGNWSVKKEIFWNIWILFTISGSDFLFYVKLFGVIHFDFGMIGNLLLLSVLPVAVLIVINQDRLLRSNLSSAIQLNDKLQENRHIDEKMISFISEYKSDNFTINVTSLILVRSADNYIEVFYEKDGTIRNSMIRSTMQKTEEAIQEFDFLFRCHRAFIVNINKIDNIEGNSQGYKVFFKHLDFPAMVSQKYIHEFKRLI